MMPTLIVDNVPVDVYDRLKKRAAAESRSLPEETLHLLTQLLREEIYPAPRLPNLIPVEEVSAPCDLPRSSQPVATMPYPGQPRLPDPVAGERPE
jgi:plasmid stability protein